MDKQQIIDLGDELYEALTNMTTLAPLTERFPDITIDDAYYISLHMLECRVQAGEKVIGKKIGVTSKAVQNMLGVYQPDFGYLTDKMLYGGEMPISKHLVQAKAEGEIAFRLKRDRSRHQQCRRTCGHGMRYALF